MKKEKVVLFWFRRDLRLNDNHGLYKALTGPFPVLPVFIFDTEITDELERDDARVSFIYELISGISGVLKKLDSNVLIKKGNPKEVWNELLDEFDMQSVHANEDYEPYAIQRDKKVKELLAEKDIPLHLYKDQVIFAKNEVLKNDGTPYTVFTPFKNKWLETLKGQTVPNYPSESQTNFAKFHFDFPKLEDLGFEFSEIKVLDFELDELDNYAEVRNFPALNQTSKLGPHLRFGTVSIREILMRVRPNEVFVSELVWREFFMQILYHFPKVVASNFRPKYDHIQWRNEASEFEKWKNGKTGYPIVDAGMRELKATGYMHNRVRMVVAGFLCKHLLIDWRWGEAYFAEHLLDYELSSNNGNWQWAAGTGCDSAPYFRVFNPTEQVKKFDKKLTYIKKWVPELDGFDYPEPMVDHKFARERALRVYKEGIAAYTG